MAQVKSDGEPMGIYTVTCKEIFHVQRLLGSLPIHWGWKLSWPQWK